MKRHNLPARRDSRITSQYIPESGDIVIGVARGFTGSGEVLYRIGAEKLAGAIEDRKELAVIVNNLGLLVLAQLCGFNLAESLDELPKALAAWGHIDVKTLIEDDEAMRIKEVTAEALRIAQRTVHGRHGHRCGLDAPDFAKGETCSCICECGGTSEQAVCAGNGCELCEDNKEFDEGPAANNGIDGRDGHGRSEGVGAGPDSQ